MGDVNTYNEQQGWFKDVYASKLKDLFPQKLKIAKRLKFMGGDMMPGGEFKEPVILSQEQGFTIAGPRSGAFALNPPISASSDFATLEPSQLMLRSAISKEVMERTKSSKNSFVRAVSAVTKSMTKTSWKIAEMLELYGRASTGIGTVSAVSTTELTITEKEWAAGLWIGAENRMLKFYTAGGVYVGLGQVNKIDIENRKVHLKSVVPGLASGAVIRLHHEELTSEYRGMQSIFENTGNLFGLDAAQYSQWRGTIKSNGNKELSFNKIMNYLAAAVNKGLEEDCDVWMNPYTYANISNEQAALKKQGARTDSNTMDNGAENIVFYYQGGLVRFHPYNSIKEGMAFIAPSIDTHFKKIGTCDVKFEDFGGGTYLKAMENNAGYELRNYWNHAVFCDDMYKLLLITDIVNQK